MSGTGTGFGPLSSRERGLVGLDLFTLTFDSSPIKGEGDWLVLSCWHPQVPTLWFPAYAGMTGRGGLAWMGVGFEDG